MLLIALALVVGLRVDMVARDASALVSVLFQPAKPPEPDPPRPRPRRAESNAAKGAPAPPNLENKATPIVAPEVVPLIVPPPVVTATEAGIGSASQTGAADQPGPSQGAGGIGDGFGGGGPGGDGDGVAAVGPRQIRGRLSFRDLPEGMVPPGSEARVGVRYIVNVDGRVSDCRADEPSGIPTLDELACDLIEQRFRFRPARDESGRPVRATIVETHSWFSHVRRPGG